MSSQGARALGGVEASFAVARVTLKRASRGMTLWVVLGLATIPEFFGPFALRGSLSHWGELFAVWLLLLAIVVPVLLASAIGEEIEEKTMAYLWSRPLPRWSIIAGKMGALVPVAWVALAIALVLPFYTMVGSEAAAHPEVLGKSLLAVLFGTLGAAAVTAGLSTLAPRFGTVLSIAYLLFIDGTLAAADASISRISVGYNAVHIAGLEGGGVVPAIGWMLGIVAVWMLVAVWRVRRIE